MLITTATYHRGVACLFLLSIPAAVYGPVSDSTREALRQLAGQQVMHVHMHLTHVHTYRALRRPRPVGPPPAETLWLPAL